MRANARVVFSSGSELERAGGVSRQGKEGYNLKLIRPGQSRTVCLTRRSELNRPCRRFCDKLSRKVDGSLPVVSLLVSSIFSSSFIGLLMVLVLGKVPPSEMKTK